MDEYLYENVEEHYGAGRPRLLNNRNELELILFYLGSAMKYSELYYIVAVSISIINLHSCLKN